MRVLIFAVTLLLATTLSGQLQVTIAVEPHSDLPGIIPSLRVAVRNNGSVPVDVPDPAALWVTPTTGDGFYAESGRYAESRTGRLEREPEEQVITVAPGTSRDLTFWHADWFRADKRLQVPGSYRLKLLVGSDLDDKNDPDVSHHPPRPTRPTPMSSNEVTYTVLEPTGEDAVVWNRMAGNGCSPQLAEEIWQSHPTSRYAAYCVPEVQGVDYAAAIALYEAAIEKNPNSMTADSYRLRIAHSELGRMHRAMSADSIANAVAASDRARVILTALARDASVPDTRRAAAEKLRTYVWTREQIQHMIDVRKGIGPKEVIPVASCVETRAGGKKFVWFGYANETRHAITVPIGSENKFTPPPFDRSQPTIFPATIRQLAFAVEANAPHLTWHIQKRQYQVKVSEIDPCPANLEELREQEERYQR